MTGDAAFPQWLHDIEQRAAHPDSRITLDGCDYTLTRARDVPRLVSAVRAVLDLADELEQFASGSASDFDAGMASAARKVRRAVEGTQR